LDSEGEDEKKKVRKRLQTGDAEVAGAQMRAFGSRQGPFYVWLGALVHLSTVFETVYSSPGILGVFTAAQREL
jgi:hypothetical protein